MTSLLILLLLGTLTGWFFITLIFFPCINYAMPFQSLQLYSDTVIKIISKEKWGKIEP